MRRSRGDEEKITGAQQDGLAIHLKPSSTGQKHDPFVAGLVVKPRVRTRTAGDALDAKTLMSKQILEDLADVRRRLVVIEIAALKHHVRQRQKSEAMPPTARTSSGRGGLANRR